MTFRHMDSYPENKSKAIGGARSVEWTYVQSILEF